jgi:Holliday junction resolvasome RuvABC endonuclease subunit
VIVLGIRCSKENLDWAVVEGDHRGTASVAEHRKVSIPDEGRGAQLAWVRKEILELIERHMPKAVAVRVAESGGQSVSLGRAEVEGVVQEALHAARLDPVRHVAASIRGSFGARNRQDLDSTLLTVPVIKDTAASRRESVVSAVALLPA